MLSLTAHNCYRWRLEKRRKQREGEAACESGPPALSHSDYHSFTVVGAEQLTKDTFLFTFGLESGQSLGLRMGQHILLRYSMHMCIGMYIELYLNGL